MPDNEIHKILESGSKYEKISTLESLDNSKDGEIIKQIILMLDDPDIEVRGEAFASLVLNENDISHYLISSLESESKNIRGFSALVLANRGNTAAIPNITKLTKDQSAMVRSCALGALGYLKANQASEEIKNCFFDSNLEVKKSALKAAIDIGYRFSDEEIKNFDSENDPELKNLLSNVKMKL
jgi:HEAT repeat protein